ncbi:MAG TPA: hypothetical protein VHX39_31485 [Acetobacteraceae bacterium]|nr:hypothetical protein [Acetobacteraceae bacterium]
MNGAAELTLKRYRVAVLFNPTRVKNCRRWYNIVTGPILLAGLLILGIGPMRAAGDPAKDKQRI